jgi:hypothetical protein
MEWIGWTLAGLFVVACNHVAARARRPSIGKTVFLISILPPLALTAFTGARLAYAVLNRDEVNRRFVEGDLSYFGADMAFGVSLVVSLCWVLLAYAGFRSGRGKRRSS